MSVVRCRKSGKIRYATEAYARAQLVGLVMKRNRGNAARQERYVYKCPSCQGWHTTKMSQPPRQA